jgi:hypothetical protein
MNDPDPNFIIDCFRDDDSTPQRFYVWDCTTKEDTANGKLDFEVRSTPTIPAETRHRFFNLKLEKLEEETWKIAWVSSRNPSNPAEKYEEVSGKGIPNFLLPEVARRYEIGSIRSGSNLVKPTSDPVAEQFNKAAKARRLSILFDGGNQQSEPAAEMWRRLKKHLEDYPCEFFVKENEDEHFYEMVRRPKEEQV